MLLFICHANICRSPMAERLARLDLANTLATHTASAGTHARNGDAIHPGAERILRELGADPSGFASRAVSYELITAASLVLTATRDQRAFCVSLAPATLRHTFTIRQFGRLAAAAGGATPHLNARLDGPDATPVAALLRRITAVRGTLQPVDQDEDNLADPVNGTDEDIRACARQIQLCLAQALPLIGAM